MNAYDVDTSANQIHIHIRIASTTLSLISLSILGKHDMMVMMIMPVVNIKARTRVIGVATYFNNDDAFVDTTVIVNVRRLLPALVDAVAVAVAPATVAARVL
jgi:hypothetical protein